MSNKINLKPRYEGNPRLGSLPSLIFDANQVLFTHACDTMPDSLSRRHLVLQALKDKTNPRHCAYVKICAQIAALESVAHLQAQLQVQLQDHSITRVARVGRRG
jgi:hypothetical protein